MKNLPILDFTDHAGIKLPAIVDSNNNVQTGPQTYTLQNGDAPTLVYRCVSPRPWVRVGTLMT